MSEMLALDGKIIELYRTGSQDALKETQRVYGAYLMTVAEGILRDRQDAEECVNDTYLRAWESIPKTQPANLKAYLAKVTRNLSISRLRNNQAKKRGGDAVITSYIGMCFVHKPFRSIGHQYSGQFKQFRHIRLFIEIGLIRV